MYNVSVSPHVRDKSSTQKIMLDVAIALLPTLGWGVYKFGFNALMLILVSVASCVLFETLFELITKKPITVFDFSAVVTGLIIAVNLPPTATCTPQFSRNILSSVRTGDSRILTSPPGSPRKQFNS